MFAYRRCWGWWILGVGAMTLVGCGPNIAELHAQAAGAMQRNAFDSAFEIYQQILEENPDDVVALRQRAKIYSGRDETDAALADYDRALELAPKDEATVVARARLYDRRNEIEEAIREYGVAIELSTDDKVKAKYFFWRGFAKERLNKKREAIDDYTKAFELDNLHHEAIANRGELYKKLGEVERGKKDTAKAIKIRGYLKS